MSGEVIKGYIGKEDFMVQLNAEASETFSRTTSTGSTMSLTKFPDLWEGYGKIKIAKIDHGFCVGAIADFKLVDFTNVTHEGSGDYGQFNPISMSQVHGSQGVPITDEHSTLSMIRYDDSSTARETAAYFMGLKSTGTVKGVRDVLVVHGESNTAHGSGYADTRGINALKGSVSVVSPSNMLGVALYGDATLGTATGAIEGLEIVVRNWSGATAPVGFTAGGSEAIKIVGQGGGAGSEYHTFAIDIVADSGFGFYNGISFGANSIATGGIILDCRYAIGAANSMVLPNNAPITQYNVANTTPYVMLNINASNEIAIAQASPGSISIGWNSAVANPLYIWVGGALKNVTIDVNGFLKGV